MIVTKNLQKAFGNTKVLCGIDEHIKKGEKVVIVGPSGSGKSTFLRCLNLLEEPTGGEVWFEGNLITDKKCDINKLRQKMGISMAHMKNILITSYGQIEYISEGQALIYKTNAPMEYIQELEEAHLKFMKQGEDGAYWYKVYRGSHTYNSQEMSQLLEGTKQEAEAVGIEVKTPDEIARLVSLWAQEGGNK